jgi:hypothetical protein
MDDDVQQTAEQWLALFQDCTPEQQEQWRQAFRPMIEGLAALADDLATGGEHGKART